MILYYSVLLLCLLFLITDASVSLPKLALLTVVGSLDTNISNSVDFEYGSLKSKVLLSISIDNKIRFANFAGIPLFIGTSKPFFKSPSDYGQAKQSLKSKRFLKVCWLKLLISKFEHVLYVDIDTFFVDPSIGN